MVRLLRGSFLWKLRTGYNGWTKMPLCIDRVLWFLFSINYFRKKTSAAVWSMPLCRVLWFVLNKLLSQVPLVYSQ